MHINRTIAILLLTLFTIKSNGQDKPNKPTKEIFVIGTASQEITPDIIYIDITIAEKYKNREKVTIGEQEIKLQNVLQELNIDINMLKRKKIDADYQKIKKMKDAETLLENEYTLKLDKKAPIKLLFEKVAAIEVQNAQIAKLSHTKIDSIKKAVRISAILAAKNKASYLLEAINETIGEPIEIKEIETTQIDNLYRTTRRNELMNIQLPEPTSEDNFGIDFQNIKIISSISVKFEVK